MMEWSMADALVLSGESFVGRHLCRALRDAGAHVTATTNVPAVAPEMEPYDLLQRESVEQIVAAARPRAIFQCAGATQTTDPRLMYRLHVEGTLNMLSAVARHAPEAVVLLIGSAAEYGTVPAEALPVGEDYPAVPSSFFGASKLAQTHAARAAAEEWGLRVLVVRPFNLIGPGLPAQYFAASLAGRILRAKAAGEGGDLEVVNAQATRDFVDVRDAAEAMVGLTARAVPPARSIGLYNIATGQETPLLAVAEKLCELAGGFRTVDAGAGRSRSGINRSCGDATRLRQATGWAPRRTWERSIEEMWQAAAVGSAETMA